MSEFPDRPTHEDFARLSAILAERDAALDSKAESLEQRVSGYVDIDSLVYVAKQRAMRLLKITTGDEAREKFEEITHYIAVYIDSFLLGAAYERAKNYEQQLDG